MVTLDGTSHHAAGGTATIESAVASNPAASQQTAVAELGRAALRGAELDDLFALALDLTRRILDVDYIKILQDSVPGEPLLLIAGQGWSDDVCPGVTTVSCDRGSQAGYTLMFDDPIVVEDLAHEERFTAPPLLIDHDVVSGMSVIIPDKERPYGVLSVHTRRRRHFTDGDAAFLRSIANVVGGAIQSDRARQQIRMQAMSQERRIRYQSALSTCASSLLSSTGDTRLEHAVEALLTATEATYVFVERNVVDPELGFCSKNLVEIDEEKGVLDVHGDPYWDLVPWASMPNSQARLETGEPFVFLPEELDGPEYDLYAASPIRIKSELDIPIFVDGEWAGLIAFADKSEVREWTEEDLTLLTTAATMIGAFWEREEAHRRLEEEIRSRDEFLASVSHELRTPLTAVLGFGQILQDESGSLSPEERSELVDTVVREATDLLNIVNDLLAAAKSDTDTLHVAQVPVNLRAQTAQALEAFEHERVHDIDLVGHSVRAVGDPHRVRQIVRNLVSNALRYGGDDIHVEVLSDAATAKVAVRDSGSPIPPVDRERIFERYQRSQNVANVPKSLGLGLAISRQLARRMGGDLTYRHEGGESIFELSLPGIR